LISLRLTAVDTVVLPPDGITQHATRGPGIEYRLEVLEGWLPQRRMISLRRANIGSEGGASSRQREKGEHTLGSEEKGVLIPRQLPVNLDICRYEIGWIIVTRERDTECVANRTVGAVACPVPRPDSRRRSLSCDEEVGCVGVRSMIARVERAQVKP